MLVRNVSPARKRRVAQARARGLLLPVRSRLGSASMAGVGTSRLVGLCQAPDLPLTPEIAPSPRILGTFSLARLPLMVVSWQREVPRVLLMRGKCPDGK